MATRVFLGLGSNRGDSRAILGSAVAELRKHLDEVRSSSIWKSAPLYLADQPFFLNLVVEAWTELTPQALLDLTSGIEAQFGRNRSQERNKGPRNLDIDILLYGSRQVTSESLTIPHPRISERKFVLLPLLEIAHDLVHPVTGLAFSSLLAELQAQGIYLLLPPRYDLLYI